MTDENISPEAFKKALDAALSRLCRAEQKQMLALLLKLTE